MSFTLFFSQSLPEGFKLKGYIDVPIVNEKIGYICLQVKFWFVNIKLAWGIK